MRTLLLGSITAAFLLGCPSNTSAPATPSTPPAAKVEAPVEQAPAGPRSTFEGRVVLEGALPTLPPLATNETAEGTCGATVQDPSLRTGEGGSLAGVVVSLEAPSDGGKGPFAPLVVDQKGCLYTPAVVAARAGSTLELLNSDPLLHNVRGAASGKSLFNVAMPLEGMRVKKSLPASPGVVELRCDVHPWMHAIVKTFDHNFFAVTDAEGRFKIENAPAGLQKVTFWHPRFGPITRELELPADGVGRLDLSVPANTVSTASLLK